MEILRTKHIHDSVKVIQFKHNQVTLSIGYGDSHYCDNRMNPEASTTTMEVAVWREGNEFERIGNDSVAGYISVYHLPKLLELLAKQDAEKKIAQYLNNL